MYILLVEDDDVLAMGMVACLQVEGHSVQRACDGQQALAFCHREMPAVVVTDMLMRTMNGPTFLRKLRQLPGGESIPVIAMTGYADPGLIAEMDDLGICTYMPKPFDVKEFLQLVKDCL